VASPSTPLLVEEVPSPYLRLSPVACRLSPVACRLTASAATPNFYRYTLTLVAPIADSSWKWLTSLARGVKARLLEAKKKALFHTMDYHQSSGVSVAILAEPS
jgi:hypothetical protein